MATECWFRNPHNYIEEVAEAQALNVAWSRGVLKKRGIDPYQHAELYFRGAEYRLLVIGEQGAAELRRGFNMNTPWAVYPVWVYGDDDFSILEEMFANPVGEDQKACSDKSAPADERPVFGQPHRVVVMDLPAMNTAPGRRIAKQLLALKEDYPEVILHVHGLYGYRPAFGLGFDSVDVEPRTSAQKGKVILPMGKELRYEQASGFAQWVTLLGYTIGDLSAPRKRCIFNIKSAMWAAENYMDNVKFRVKGSANVDPNASKAPTTKSHRTSSQPVKPGDKMLCSSCSLAPSCKYYRDEAVCSVPGSQPEDLARLFRTRNAASVIDGLHELLGVQAQRLDRGMREEDTFEELDPEVTRIAHGLFNNGVKLAKLLNPELNGRGIQVGVQVNNGSAGAVAGANPNSLVAGLVAQLEAQGVPRDKITPEMIQNLLTDDHENLAIGAGEIDQEVIDLGEE